MPEQRIHTKQPIVQEAQRGFFAVLQSAQALFAFSRKSCLRICLCFSEWVFLEEGSAVRELIVQGEGRRDRGVPGINRQVCCGACSFQETARRMIERKDKTSGTVAVPRQYSLRGQTQSCFFYLVCCVRGGPRPTGIPRRKQKNRSREHRVAYPGRAVSGLCDTYPSVNLERFILQMPNQF